MSVWAYTRHYLNLRIIASLLPGGEFQTVGPYELNWITQQYKCWISQIITFGLLASLQAVNIFWFFLIIRILVRLVTTGEEKDERSDDEEEEDAIEQMDGPQANGSASGPQVVLNGQPIEAPGTGIDGKASAGLRKR